MHHVARLARPAGSSTAARRCRCRGTTGRSGAAGPVLAADLVEPLDQRFQGPARASAPSKSRGPQLVLLRVQELLAARADRLRPRTARIRSRRPSWATWWPPAPPGWRTSPRRRSAAMHAGCRGWWGRSSAACGRSDCDQLDAVVDELLLAGAPGEVGVGLAEADAGRVRASSPAW